MARFQIQDPKSGKTVVIEGDKMPSQADAEQIFHQAGLRAVEKPQQQIPQQTNQFSNPILHNLLGTAGNIAKDIGTTMGIQQNSQLPNSLNDTLIYAQQATNKAGSVKNPQEKQRLQKVAQLDAQTVSNIQAQQQAQFSPDVTQNPLQRAGIAASEIAGSAEIPGAVSSLANRVAKAGQYLTKKGTANLATTEAKKATEKGVAIHWDQISSQIRNKVKDTLGYTGDVKDSLNNLLSEKTPAGIESVLGSLDLSPSDLLQWRRQISARGASSGILGNLFKGTNIESKVSSIARQEVSNTIHKLVPTTVTPDKLYSFYSKIKGDVPTWAKRIIAEELLRRTIGGPLVRAISGATSSASQ